MAEEEQHISTDRARAGETPGAVRYVLAIGIGLIVVLFGVLLLVWQ